MLKKYCWIAAVVTFLVISSHSDAWTGLGITWPNGVAAYYVNPRNDSGIPGETVVAELAGAANTWASVGASFNFCFQEITDRAIVARNGFNDVFFRPLDMGGAIAVTYIWGDRFTGIYDEFDVAFNEGRFTFFSQDGQCGIGGFYTWYIGMHELGHALGLGHSADRTAIMYAGARSCDTRTAIEPDDIDGVLALYGPGPAPGCQ